MTLTLTESEVFQQLRMLCGSNGYVHVIAYFCHRDNFFKIDEKKSISDQLEQQSNKFYSGKQLIRTEISTLMGLMLKSKIDLTIPQPQDFQDIILKTEKLLLDLHHAISLPLTVDVKRMFSEKDMSNPFTKGVHLREPIFYGSESAYNFQYDELSKVRYANDEKWIARIKGFSIEQACTVASAIMEIQSVKAELTNLSLQEISPEAWTILDVFSFTIEDIVLFSGVEPSVVSNIINSFTFPKDSFNSGFVEIGSFNLANPYPIIRIDDNKFIIFQHYSLLESIYESPYFWFLEDREYKNIAMKNRGSFTENFSAQRFSAVFGKERVFENIELKSSKKNIACEIDTLIVYADTLIIVQAKSKKLTIESRRGNDNAIKDDFKKAVQNAYDQAFQCARALLEGECDIENLDLAAWLKTKDIKRIHIICLVSDHYPALSFQTEQFLQYEVTDVICAPIVADVFFLDTLVEILYNPLVFLDFINKRVKYSNEISGNNEFAILGYYLTNNLYFEHEKPSRVHFDESFSHSIDFLMMSRRGALPYPYEIENSILDRCRANSASGLLSNIGSTEFPEVLDLGFLILNLNSSAYDEFNQKINRILQLSRGDGKNHDLSMSFDGGDQGFTIHCNSNPVDRAESDLKDYCHYRKYQSKADVWYGVLLCSRTKVIKLISKYDFPWVLSDEIQSIPTHILQRASQAAKPVSAIPRKIGRNDVCYCGSGLKYKKCCSS
jgi:hypothetical protein